MSVGVRVECMGIGGGLVSNKEFAAGPVRKECAADFAGKKALFHEKGGKNVGGIGR